MNSLFSILWSAIFILQNPTDRASFYTIMAESNYSSLLIAIDKYESLPPSTLTNAYLGGLYMRKSEHVQGLREKQKAFNKGRKLLEAEIALFPELMELRLIRFMIQENCPKALKYNDKLEEDKRIIVAGYKKAEPTLKRFIQKYSENSQNLKPENLPVQ